MILQFEEKEDINQYQGFMSTVIYNSFYFQSTNLCQVSSIYFVYCHRVNFIKILFELMSELLDKRHPKQAVKLYSLCTAFNEIPTRRNPFEK